MFESIKCDKDDLIRALTCKTIELGREREESSRWHDLYVDLHHRIGARGADLLQPILEEHYKAMERSAVELDRKYDKGVSRRVLPC